MLPVVLGPALLGDLGEPRQIARDELRSDGPIAGLLHVREALEAGEAIELGLELQTLRGLHRFPGERRVARGDEHRLRRGLLDLQHLRCVVLIVRTPELRCDEVHPALLGQVRQPGRIALAGVVVLRE